MPMLRWKLRQNPDVEDQGLALPMLESSGSFLERVEAQPPLSWLVHDLLPDEGIVVWHGRPRSFKSLCALDLLLAAATGTPAFGSERFVVPAPVGPVVYLTEEDGERLVAQRLRWLLAGRGLSKPPDNLFLRVRAGLNLEDSRDQKRVITAVRETEARLVCLDPARAFVPSLDKGPADAAAAIRFLRNLQNQTSAKTVLMPHHDTKPRPDGKDSRARAERASGGAIFSIADCPANFERVDDRTALVVPSSYKVGSDPSPFRVTFESETGAGEPFRHFVRAVASDTTEKGDRASRTEAAVLAEIGNEWIATKALRDATRKRKDDVLAALRALDAAGKVESREVGRGAREYRRPS